MAADDAEKGKWNLLAPIYGQRPHTLSVSRELNDRGKRLARFPFGPGTLDVIRGREVIWLVLRLAGRGGVAVRGIYSPDGDLEVESIERRDGGLTLYINGTTMGRFRAVLTILDAEAAFVR